MTESSNRRDEKGERKMGEQRGQTADAPPEGIKDKLGDMYYRRYAEQWQKFLQEVKVREFKQKEEQRKMLQTLAGTGGNASPLDSLLIEVARQTNLSAKPSDGWFGWIKNLFASKVRGDGIHRQVEKEFTR